MAKKDATRAAKKLDHELIRDLAELLDETGLSEIEIEQAGLRVRVARNLAASAVMSPPAPASASSAASSQSSPGEERHPAPSSNANAHPGAITSPMVGTAYLSPEPGARPFVNVGDHVVEGQTLLIVEAMKTMNEIIAPRAGKIAAILVENKQPVEFGEPLVIIE
jgi:acetyl-CoA carboxylase biotin carboxyl carrier protein